MRLLLLWIAIWLYPVTSRVTACYQAVWHWLVHVGDEIPAPVFPHRQQMRQALNKRKRAQAAARAGVAQPALRRRLKPKSTRRMGAAKRRHRCARRFKHACLRDPPPPKSQQALDREELEFIRDMQPGSPAEHGF